MDPHTMVMAFPFAAVAGAVLPGLVDGIVGNNQQKRQISSDRAKELRERYYFGRDRKNERKYQAKLTKKDRAYAEKRLADERRYAAGVTASDRAYSEKIYDRDRKVFVSDRDLAEKKYMADRAKQQALSDRQAERSAASRGLDFKTLRDDAVKAGYNPLTALQFATSYARDVNYGVEGGVYGGYGATSPGGGAVGSTVAGPGAVPGSSVAAYSSPGGGFTSQTSAPILASRDSLLQAGVDGILTYFNEQDARDQETYRSIEQQVASGQLARLLQSQNPYQGFGYSTKQPFQPHIDVSNGQGLRWGGVDIPVTGATSDASEAEQVFGDPGDVLFGLKKLDESGTKMVGEASWGQRLKWATWPWSSIIGFGSEVQTGTRPVKTPFAPPRRPGQDRSGPQSRLPPAWGW